MIKSIQIWNNLKWRHDIRHNDKQPMDTQLFKFSFSAFPLSYIATQLDITKHAKFLNSEIILSAIVLSVIMASVAAPL